MEDLYNVNCVVLEVMLPPSQSYICFFNFWRRWKVVWEELLPRLFCGRRSLWTTSHCTSHIYGVGFVESIDKYFHFSSFSLTRISTKGSVTNRSAIKNFHNCQIQIEARIGVIGPEGVSRETARFWLSKKIKTSLKMHEQRIDLSNTLSTSHRWTMVGDQQKKSHMMVNEP